MTPLSVPVSAADAIEFGRQRTQQVAIHGAGACSAGVIVVNGARLSFSELAVLYDTLGEQLPAAGCYWYDRLSGAWGRDGEALAGQIAAGIGIGGALRTDASAGDSGVFINGRELPMIEVARFYANRIPLAAGRYWMDASGAIGRLGEYASWTLAESEDNGAPPQEIYGLGGGGSGIVDGDCVVISGDGYSGFSSGCDD